MLEQYRISDFIEWSKAKKLKLNPDFQRGSVWSPPARVFLIDTILRGLPIPKIYLRTTTDIETMTSIRDVVDGQQRLRAILDFSEKSLINGNNSDHSVLVGIIPSNMIHSSIDVITFDSSVITFCNMMTQLGEQHSNVRLIPYL